MSALEKKLKSLPRKPGVYLFKDARDKIIYVGKARNLMARVNSYFSKSGESMRVQIPYMRSALRDVDVIVTDTESEAFLLENTLIKKHQPRFNIRLRDDKDFYSIRIDTSKEYPRLEWIRTRTARARDGGLYFGPYSNSRAVKESVRLLQKLFPLRSCSDHMMRNRTRPCLLHPLGRCCAPCVLDVPHEEYNALVENTALFLGGKRDAVANMLRDKMDEASEKMEFERAAVYRDQIKMIDAALAEEKVVGLKKVDRDAIAHAVEDEQAVFVVFQYREGALTGALDFEVVYRGEPLGKLYYGFVQQYYNDTSRIPPREIISMHLPDDKNLLEEYLLGLRRDDRLVRLHTPSKGEKRKIILMARDNARQKIKERKDHAGDLARILDNLAQVLKLPAPPENIECVDISNISGVLTVASVVVFQHGEPSKNDYRRYKITTAEKSDDYAAMKEVLSRRFGKVISADSPLPDLLLLDGGRGHLNIARQVMADLGIEGLGLAAIAKEHDDGAARRHAGALDRVFIPGRTNPVNLPSYSPALQLLRRVRDEAHRFAISYHRMLRKKGHLRSILDEIPGVGPKKKKALLLHFGSVARIREATCDEISQVEGINHALAESISHFLMDTK